MLWPEASGNLILYFPMLNTGSVLTNLVFVTTLYNKVTMKNENVLCSHKISTIWFQNVFTIPQRNPTPISSHSPAPSAASSLHLLTYFLFLWVCLFGTFHVNRIIQHLAFCVLVLSLSITFPRLIHLIPKWLHHFQSHQQCLRVPISPHSCQCLSALPSTP